MSTATFLSTLSTTEILLLQSSVLNSTDAKSQGLTAAILAASGTNPPADSLTTDEKTTKALCEFSLYHFMQTFWRYVEPETPFIDGTHIRALALHLEHLFYGTFESLLINCPPGVCKSLLCSVFFPAWAWTHNPTWRTMSCSYEQGLSTRDCRRSRQIIRSPLFRALWPEAGQLRRDEDQKTRYGNIAGGWRLGTSVAGKGTGEHPDLIVVDDPIKEKLAHRERERQNVNDWWDGTISSRGVMRNVRRLVIMQRLHQQDLAGHILENEEDFVAIVLPMRAEKDRMKRTPIGWMDARQPGELLWPQGHDEGKVRKTERRLGTPRASSQLQQRPIPLGGGMFKRTWFVVAEEAAPPVTPPPMAVPA